jgi:predicted PurR-regulated permease PerM
VDNQILQKIIRIGLIAAIFTLFGVVFTPFLTPLLMAAIFAFALERLVSRFSWRANTRHVPTIFILFGFFFVVASPIALVVYKVVVTAQQIRDQGLTNTQLYQSLEQLLVRVDTFGRSFLERMNISTADLVSPAELVGKGGTLAVGWVANLASRTPELILDLFIFSLALYFFLTESKWIRKTVASFRVFTEREITQIVQVVQRSSYTTLVVTATVGAIQALIVTVGGLIFGFSEFLLIFVLTLVASFIPVIGAAPMALLLAVLALVQGYIPGAIGMTVVALVAGSMDNILKPYLMSATSEDSPSALVSLFVILGAVMTYGLPGLLLGPILLELALRIVPILYPAEPEETSASIKG